MDFNNSRTHKFLLMLGDILCILIAYVSAFYIRYFDFPDPNWDAFISLLPWIIVIGLFLISVYELYIIDGKQTLSDLFRKILVVVTMLTFLTMASSYLFRAFAMPRSVIVISTVFMVVYLLVFNAVFLKLTRRNVVGKFLIVGNKTNTDQLITKINYPMLKGSEYTCVREGSNIKNIRQMVIDSNYIILCTDISKELKSQVIYHAMEHNKEVYVIPTLYELVLQRATTSPLDDTLVMGVKPFILTWEKLFFKRIFDIIFSFIILVLISPILIVMGVIIKLEDPKAAAIFKQERLGKDDKPFTIYKFRSMISDAESYTGPVLASTDDDRITKVGKFIRATRIDELPQFFNVLKGDMSIVGPRPEREFFINKLLKEHYHYGYRNRVKPGITGYAQVMGKYTTVAEDKLRFDLFYIRNYSFWLDLLIILKTVLVVFDKSKSEGTETENNIKEKNNIYHHDH
ncbi:exopolysaccharide biosynthesis polyprenyl glycosylphosphotransferase [Pelagirhabdus alkalitolerans]|uniref:Exopolysaccharide biosynthesis polyprenyl glycosylphosphotransferase n=2 Tax=Pelagirhabdus alkalitolerans TaxID=1612202 RepID=A0A1G6GJF1_9BACI|nr:exopolysaccharide biosynthesis polyprenyl glycosylphosphotransferase [Pelagirhabdus alkalitolerans]